MNFSNRKLPAFVPVLSLMILSCAPETKAPNVLLIVVDTLRPDRMSLYGAERPTTPALDSLAGQACVFERAYSTSSWTMPAVASIMTGMYPSSHKATEISRTLAPELETLAEGFAASGFQTAAVVSHTFVDEKHGFDQGFAAFDSKNALGHEAISTEGVTDLAIARIEQFTQKRKTPFFLFVHYFDPHFNYKDHPDIDFAAPHAGRLDGKQEYGDIRAIRHSLQDDELQYLLDLYDEEIRHTDAGIGRLVAALRKHGLDEETVIVFASDHGEEFLDHGRIGHRKTLYEEVVRVPMLIRVPGGAARRVADPVSIGSLAPTIRELAGLPRNQDAVQFRSLADLVEGRATSTRGAIYLETEKTVGMVEQEVKGDDYHAIILDGWKLIEDRRSGEQELFDLSRDPLESANLASQDTARLATLKEALEVSRRLATSGQAPGRDRTLSDAEIEKLRGLGYIGD